MAFKLVQKRTYGRFCTWDFDRTAGAAGQIPFSFHIGEPQDPRFGRLFFVSLCLLVCLVVLPAGGARAQDSLSAQPAQPEGGTVFSREPLPADSAWAAESPEDSSRPYLVRLLERSPVRPAGEIRALWVVRDALTSRARIDRLVDFAARGRFHLLFAQVRGRGDAYYRSSLEPEGAGLERPVTEFDPFGYLLLRAHEAGIAVHAWVNVFYVWSNPHTPPPPGHIVDSHPDWLITGPDGVRVDAHPVDAWSERSVEGYFVAPDHLEARAFTVAVIKEITTNYSVDGIHLDYIRYPGAGFGYRGRDRADFMLLWGVDPLALATRRGPLLETAGGGALAFLDSLVLDQRVAAVDSLVLAVDGVIGKLPLSAAVFPDPQAARVDKGQDWVKWAQLGYLDFVVPMAYTYRPNELKIRMQFIRNLIGREKLLAGLPLFNERVNHLKTSIQRLRQADVLGFTLFSYNVMEDSRFAVQFLYENLFEELPDSLEQPAQEDRLEQESP
jgi:hypothetical protein